VAVQGVGVAIPKPYCYPSTIDVTMIDFWYLQVDCHVATLLCFPPAVKQ
jgi:hypothetical protein